MYFNILTVKGMPSGILFHVRCCKNLPDDSRKRPKHVAGLPQVSYCCI